MKVSELLDMYMTAVPTIMNCITGLLGLLVVWAFWPDSCRPVADILYRFGVRLARAWRALGREV